MLHVSISVLLLLSALLSLNSGLPSLGTAKPATPKTTTTKPTTPKPTTHKPTTPKPTTPGTWTTKAGASGANLNWKMFTLSSNGGGITIYPPSFSPTHGPSTTYYPRPTTHRPRTTVIPTRGVSVCLRYLADENVGLFTLNQYHEDALSFSDYTSGYYIKRGYSGISFATNIRLWQNLRTDFWTRVCLTVDTMKNVAQVFSGYNMSIRKILPVKYIWSGVPVISFPGFDGQVTDVHVWDYPLSNGEVLNYMTNGPYGPYRGSVLSWSDLSYSCTGRVLLEDTYQWEENQPVRSKGKKERRPKGEKKSRKLFYEGESKRKEL